MKRWPIIRHVRWLLTLRHINRHYAMWSSLGYFPVHAQYDYDMLDKIWRGEV